MPRTRGVVVQISAEENTGRAFSAVNEQISALKAQIASLRAQLDTAGVAGERFGRGMYAQMTYASSAVREFEGQLPIRAVERFMTETLGLGPILSAAFPVVGAIAFGAIIIRDVAELMKAREAAQQLAATIAAAFDQAIAKEREHADELATTNDKLEETIARIQHKPAENGLAAGIHEATLESDKLQDSLHSAVEAAKALFADQYKVSMLGRLMGEKSTSGVKDEVTDAFGQVDKIRGDYADVIQQARDSGNSKEHIDELNQMMLGRVQGVYSALDSKLNSQLKDALDKQYDDKKLGGTGANYQPLINSLQGALGLSQAQQRTLGEQYRQSQLAPIASQDRGDAVPKTKDDAQRMLAAQQAFGDAMRKQQEQAAAGLAALAKLEADTEIAQLDDKHKRGLVSEADYYAQRAALQEKAIDAEIAATYNKQGALRDEMEQRIIGLGKETDPAKRVGDSAHIVDLQTQLAKLDQERVDLAAKRGKIATEAATEEYLTTQKMADEAAKLAAQLEGMTGGSTSARIASSRRQYSDWQRANAGASPDEVASRQAIQSIDEAQINAQGAQQDSGVAVSGINAQRSAISHAVSTGAMSQVQAQQERIALDREEAEALGPVLQAYQALADAGDNGAAEKVAELQERIAELKAPVNEVAAEIRGQLNSALEQLFENMGKGKNAWKDFVKSMQGDALKDTYQQFLAPLAQMGLGHVLPNSGGMFGGSQQQGTPSLLSRILPSLGRLPSFSPGAGRAGQPIVQIINQTSAPAKGTATQTGGDDGSGMLGMLRGPITQVILEDLDRGGSIAQAFGGVAGALNA